MRKGIVLAAAAAAMAVMAGLPTTAAALQRPNILIMGEDADEDTVPRNSRVFRRVLDAISNQMFDRGFDVFDETAVTLNEVPQDRVRRTDAELIDVARGVGAGPTRPGAGNRPPIDVVVAFSIYASAQKAAYTTRVRSRITGRLIEISGGRRLGNFEVVSPQDWRAPADCPRECLLEVVGDHAKVLAQDVGAVLAEKLAYLVESPAQQPVATDRGSVMPNLYTLVFEGFNQDDISTIEEYIVVFSGYQSHRPKFTGMRHHEYEYRSEIEDAKLLRNLNKMMDHLGVQARVSHSARVYTVQKITQRQRLRINPKEW